MMITQKRLKEVLDYNPLTGLFTWKVNLGSRALIGNTAGTKSTKSHSGKSYLVIRLDTVLHTCHKLIWIYVYGKPPTGTIDHINGNGTDNRLENLRETTALDNSHNLKKFSNNTSGVTGVWQDKRTGKWVAEIKVSGKKISLGRSFSFLDVCCLRKSAELEYSFHKNHGTNRPL